MNNQILLNYHGEAQRMNGTLRGEFDRNKLKEFYRNNGIRINAVIEKVNALHEKYFIFEGKEVKFEGDGKERKPVMKEGMVMVDYEKEFKELMEKPCNIVL